MDYLPIFKPTFTKKLTPQCGRVHYFPHNSMGSMRGKNQGAFEKIEKEQGSKKNEKGAEKKFKGARMEKIQGSRG